MKLALYVLEACRVILGCYVTILWCYWVVVHQDVRDVCCCTCVSILVVYRDGVPICEECEQPITLQLTLSHRLLSLHTVPWCGWAG